MNKVQVSIMGCAVVAALAIASAPAQARADHGCGYRSGGYSEGYVVVNPSYRYSYQSPPVYYGNSYQSHGHRQLDYSGYSRGHHEYSGPRSHSDGWNHESRRSSSHGGHSEWRHRHHDR